jgi:hypothetical protein
MAVTATVATVASVGVSAYSAYETADAARQAQNLAEENQKKLEAAAKAEDEKSQRDAQIIAQRREYSRKQSLASLAGRRGRASTILTDSLPVQRLGG